jgi:hypothetical protein
MDIPLDNLDTDEEVPSEVAEPIGEPVPEPAQPVDIPSLGQVASVALSAAHQEEVRGAGLPACCFVKCTCLQPACVLVGGHRMS